MTTDEWFAQRLGLAWECPFNNCRRRLFFYLFLFLLVVAVNAQTRTKAVHFVCKSIFMCHSRLPFTITSNSNSLSTSSSYSSQLCAAKNQSSSRRASFVVFLLAPQCREGDSNRTQCLRLVFESQNGKEVKKMWTETRKVIVRAGFLLKQSYKITQGFVAVASET